MLCNDCLDNCDPLVTDRCTKYTGAEVTKLGICKGMSLFEIEKIILDKLLIVADTDQITFTNINTTCDFIVALLFDKGAQPFTLQKFAEIVFDGFCKADAKLNNFIAANPPEVFTTLCLTGDLSSRQKVIQALITKVCALDTRVTTLETTTVKQTDLCAQVQACITPVTPTPTIPQYKDRMVPFTYVPYAGPLNNFDNTGKGLASAGFDKIFLANGLNNTQDWRGRSPIGAIQNVPGASLDSAVDPGVAINFGNNYTVGGKQGVTNVALTLPQTPTHNHVLTDPGHLHFTFSPTGSGNAGTSTTNPFSWSSIHANGNQDYDLCTTSGIASVGPTNVSKTGISLAPAGGNQPHTNLHPVIGTLYITFIP